MQHVALESNVLKERLKAICFLNVKKYFLLLYSILISQGISWNIPFLILALILAKQFRKSCLHLWNRQLEGRSTLPKSLDPEHTKDSPEARSESWWSNVLNATTSPRGFLSCQVLPHLFLLEKLWASTGRMLGAWTCLTSHPGPGTKHC